MAKITTGTTARNRGILAGLVSVVVSTGIGWYAATTVHNTPTSDWSYILKIGLVLLFVCTACLWYGEVDVVSRNANPHVLRVVTPIPALLGTAALTAWLAAVVFGRLVTIFQTTAVQLFMAGAVALVLQAFAYLTPKLYVKLRKGYESEGIDPGPIISLLVRPVHLYWFWITTWLAAASALTLGLIIAS